MAGTMDRSVAELLKYMGKHPGRPIELSEPAIDLRDKGLGSESDCLRILEELEKKGLVTSGHLWKNGHTQYELTEKGLRAVPAAAQAIP